MMTNIKSDASPNEMSSPFYQKNQQICENWEDFINEFNGKIKGKFTAWALLIHAEIMIKGRKWNFEIEKSTMTNSSLYHIVFDVNEIHLSIKIKTTQPNLFQNNFSIRPKKKMDFLWRRWQKNYSIISPNLILITKTKRDTTLNVLLDKISTFKQSTSIKSVAYNQISGDLLIQLNSVANDWEFIRSLIELSI